MNFIAQEGQLLELSAEFVECCTSTHCFELYCTEVQDTQHSLDIYCKPARLKLGGSEHTRHPRAPRVAADSRYDSAGTRFPPWSLLSAVPAAPVTLPNPFPFPVGLCPAHCSSSWFHGPITCSFFLMRLNCLTPAYVRAGLGRIEAAHYLGECRRCLLLRRVILGPTD